MTRVDVLILHAEPGDGAGPLERALAAAREQLAERHRRGFEAAGAAQVHVVAGPPDNASFGARVRSFVAGRRPGGLVVLGSGSAPLATARDREAFVAAAGQDRPIALANNRYSADIVAIACAGRLADLPDLATDNGLPRWLADAGYNVRDLRRRRRLQVDVDGPLDLVLLGDRQRLTWPSPDIDVGRVRSALAAVGAVARDPSAELVVAGRTSAAALRDLERRTASRSRVLVEERGFRTSGPGQRPPRSVLGLLLDASGAASLGSVLAGLGDAALVDSRVLLAHRLGPDERAWPSAEDRFASDLLLHERITDPWLRDLTRSAAVSPIPIVLGGHTLVGPGLRLALDVGAETGQRS